MVENLVTSESNTLIKLGNINIFYFVKNALKRRVSFGKIHQYLSGSGDSSSYIIMRGKYEVTFLLSSL